MGVTSLGRHTRPACNQALLAMCWLKKWMLTSIECVFLDFWDARGLGPLFVVCACAVGLRGNRLTGMRGTWGVVWRSAHVPTIPFTWLRRANALDPTTHASNYQALLTRLKLCQECRFNSCVRVFLIPWGHVAKTLICDVKKSHGRNARFWLVETKFAALWLVTDYCSHLYYLLVYLVIFCCLSFSTSDRKSKTTPRNKHQIIRQIRVDDRNRGTQREYSSKPHKHSNIERTSVIKDKG